MNFPNEMVFCGAPVVESFYCTQFFFHTRNLKVKEFSVFIGQFDPVWEPRSGSVTSRVGMATFSSGLRCT